MCHCQKRVHSRNLIIHVRNERPKNIGVFKGMFGVISPDFVPFCHNFRVHITLSYCFKLNTLCSSSQRALASPECRPPSYRKLICISAPASMLRGPFLYLVLCANVDAHYFVLKSISPPAFTEIGLQMNSFLA